MRLDRWKYVFWFIVIGSWVAGFSVSRWIGSNETIVSMGQVIGVPNPMEIGAYWEIFAYFALSTVSAFLLSNVLFGVGAVFFFFARGMHDNYLFVFVEEKIGEWSLAGIPMDELKIILLIVLILGLNLPMVMWSGQLGIQRSVYTLSRFRNKPVSPKFGSRPFSRLILVVSLGLVAGLISALLFSYL